VAAGVLHHVRDRRHALERGAHAVAIVLTAEDDGEFVDGGHVEGFMEGADVDGRLAEVADADLVAVLVADREPDPRGEWDVPPDDPVPAQEPPPGVEQMHRATLALGAAGRLAEQLGHHGGGRHAPRQGLTMLTVRRDHVVVVPQGRERPDRDGLLPDVEMAEPADLAERVRLGGLLLEATDQEHLAQHASPQLRLGGGAHVRGPGGGGGHYAVACSTCSHAWSLERTSGPASTWRYPISRPSRRSSANSSGA